MSGIEDIDKNFKIKMQLSEKNIDFRDVKQTPFTVYGAAQIDECGIYRLPGLIAEKVNTGVSALCSNTAGVRIRFKTDSDYIAVFAEYSSMKAPLIIRMRRFPAIAKTLATMKI